MGERAQSCAPLFRGIKSSGNSAVVITALLIYPAWGQWDTGPSCSWGTHTTPRLPPIATAAAGVSLRCLSGVSPSYGCSTGEMSPLPSRLGGSIENRLLVQGWGERSKNSFPRLWVGWCIHLALGCLSTLHTLRLLLSAAGPRCLARQDSRGFMVLLLTSAREYFSPASLSPFLEAVGCWFGPSRMTWTKKRDLLHGITQVGLWEYITTGMEGAEGYRNG